MIKFIDNRYILFIVIIKLPGIAHFFSANAAEIKTITCLFSGIEARTASSRTGELHVS